MTGPTPPTSADRRQHARYGLTLCVGCQTEADYITEWTENISAGGFFVRTDRLLSPGQAIELHVSFPGLLEEIIVTGRIAWTRPGTPLQPGGVGVEVTSDVGRRRLAELALKAQNARHFVRPRAYRVLVVEDNPRVTRSYERVFNHLSALVGGRVELCFAANGVDALRQLDKQPVDLVITDLYMPVMDGFTFIARLRALPAGVAMPIIVITGGRADEQARVLALGVQGFLHKPIQFGQLLETIVCLLAPERPGVVTLAP